VSEKMVRTLFDSIAALPSIEIIIDVEELFVVCPVAGVKSDFPLDPAVQHRLLNGLDDIGLTLAHTDAIDSFEAGRPDWLPSLA
ncbi:MAG: 3-isopropylmalate dehydratase small subunit, partial [bacterium]|nr:3-isopropylmalate dehydratase small subunit [bacterium]